MHYNKIENLSVEGSAGACRHGGTKGKVRNENSIELIQMVVLIEDCRRLTFDNVDSRAVLCYVLFYVDYVSIW